MIIAAYARIEIDAKVLVNSVYVIAIALLVYLANYFYESGLFEYAEPDLMEDNLIDCIIAVPLKSGIVLLNI